MAAVIAATLGTPGARAEPALQRQLPPPSAHIAPLAVDFHGEAASLEARAAARAAFEGFDAKGRPFAVVDKKEAKLFVFNADGQLVGAAPALLGLARGDSVAPGVGEMVSMKTQHVSSTELLCPTPAAKPGALPGWWTCSTTAASS